MINDCEKLLESVGTDTDNKICLAKKTDKDDESLENGRWVEFIFYRSLQEATHLDLCAKFFLTTKGSIKKI